MTTPLVRFSVLRTLIIIPNEEVVRVCAIRAEEGITSPSVVMSESVTSLNSTRRIRHVDHEQKISLSLSQCVSVVTAFSKWKINHFKYSSSFVTVQLYLIYCSVEYILLYSSMNELPARISVIKYRIICFLVIRKPLLSTLIKLWIPN